MRNKSEQIVLQTTLRQKFHIRWAGLVDKVYKNDPSKAPKKFRNKCKYLKSATRLKT